MSITVIEGCQWGDEGKGKITDYLTSCNDIVVRYQGGNNAGHTIVVKGKKYALKSLPSGIISPKITNVIADGVVLNPLACIEEIENLKKAGIKKFNLLISNRCHLIMPYHIDQDGNFETKAKSKDKIGTTKRGIGPTYADKMDRRSIRAGDLLEPDFLKEKLEMILSFKNKELKGYGLKPYTVKQLYDQLMKAAKYLKPFICDAQQFLIKAVKAKKNILFEGAQGMMLDIDRGTYPYVTSSSPSACYAPQGAGIPPHSINNVVAICKAYTTRVGAGPFPSELANALGDQIREIGHEYGTVTKRPRRVGYLDLVVVKQMLEMSGAPDIALMLFDVLIGIKPLKVCYAYKLDGKTIDYIPASINEYSRCKPIYKEFKPYTFNAKKVKSRKDLPKEAEDYIKFIEKTTGVPVSIISLSPDRKDTLISSKFAAKVNK